MKTTTTWIFALFIFCSILTSCSNDDEEYETLFLIEDVQANDQGDTPIDDDDITGG